MKAKISNLKLNKYIAILIITIFSCMVFILEFQEPTGIYYSNNNTFFQFITCFYESMKPFETMWVLLFGLIFYFNFNILFNDKTTKFKQFFSFIIGIILTTITIIGKSLAIDNTLNTLQSSNVQILKIIIISLGYFFLFYTSSICILNFEPNNIKKKPKSKLENFFNKHTYLISIILILIAWLPIIIIFYPGVASGDTLDALAQYFGQKELSWSARDIVLLNEDVIINKHHSVLFTFILGSIVQIGEYISTFNFGAFLFITLQIIILLISFAWLLNYLKKIEIPFWIRISSLLFYAFCPIVSFYAIAIIKDTFGSILILIYNAFMLKIIKNYNILKNKKFIIIFMIIILLTAMIKSNGFLIIIVSYLSLLLSFIKDKIKFKKLFLIGLVPIIIFIGYDKVLLPSLDVTGTNKKESFSIPFMQVARLVNRNEDVIEYEDKKTINKILNYAAIKKDYEPDFADPVKNTYNKHATEEELKEFWNVYFKYFKKYPKLYLAAFINSTYAYFFPEVGETKGIMEIDYRLGKDTIFNIANLPKLYTQREIVSRMLDIIERLPFLSLFNHVAFYDWSLIFSVIYIIKKKKYKYIVPLTSLIYIFISCLISPINGSFRYILSLVFCFPLIISIDYITHKESSTYKKIEK